MPAKKERRTRKAIAIKLENQLRTEEALDDLAEVWGVSRNVAVSVLAFWAADQKVESKRDMLVHALKKGVKL